MTGDVIDRLGKVSEWNEARGFGFVAPVDNSESAGRVFFHVRDYDQGPRRPQVGELVKFSAAKRDGRWRATRVRRAVASTTRRAAPVPPTHRPGVHAARKPASASALVALVLAYSAGVAFAVQHDRLPGLLPFWLLAANGLSLLLYYGDKTAAQRGESRIAESTLHLIEVAGGWPAALLAQRLLRHKTSKASYQSAFWAMAGLHITIVAAMAFAAAPG